MRSSFAPSVVALLCACVGSCGGGTSGGGGSTSQPSSGAAATASTRATTESSATPPGSYLKDDGDDDRDDKNRHVTAAESDDAPYLASFGKRSSQADRQAVVALVKRYYAAVAGGDGARACSQLHSSLVSGLVEDQGQSVQSVGRTCAAVMSRLLRQRKQLTASDAATMVVVDVRVKGALGLVALGFRSRRVSQILVKREGGAWKIDALFDSEMT